LTFKIFTDHMNVVIHSSVSRAADEPVHPNRRLRSNGGEGIVLG